MPQRPDRIARIDRQLEKEEADDGRQPRLRQPALVHGDVFGAALVSAVSEQAGDRLLGVADAPKRGVELLCRGAVGN